jgi:glycosyltransferase involved in cell wall biosynthesis
MFRSLPPASHRHVAVAGADELWTLLLAGDLFLWPSLDEDLSVTALAAQAAGLGVVAGRSSAMLDVVADGQTGMLVNPGNDASIANAVGFLLRHPEFRRNLSERAPGWVMANFEMKAVARRLDAALRRACEPRAANGPAP